MSGSVINYSFAYVCMLIKYETTLYLIILLASSYAHCKLSGTIMEKITVDRHLKNYKLMRHDPSQGIQNLIIHLIRTAAMQVSESTSQTGPNYSKTCQPK